MEYPKVIVLRLHIDKEKKKVVFAECDKYFVDLLFSFLTFPIGTIISLTNKQSKLGCMDALYQSVEDLDTQYFETEACKAMLLEPRSASDHTYKNLIVDVCDSADSLKQYTCPTWTCATETHCLLSLFEDATCLCGLKMDVVARLQRENIYIDNTDFEVDYEGDEGVVFVKGNDKFIVTDDLRVSAASTEACLPNWGFDMQDGKVIRKKMARLGEKEVLKLLMFSLHSKTPLTDVFVLKKKEKEITTQAMLNNERNERMKLRAYPTESPTTITKTMILKLFISKSNNKVVYAVAKGDLLNFLFSFMAFPTVSVVKLLAQSTSIGSMNNLHTSLKGLSQTNPKKFGECQELLFHPRVACHHGWENQILAIEEERCKEIVNKCSLCFDEALDGRDIVYRYGFCMHGIESSKLNLINPKYPNNTSTARGGGFVPNSTAFLITDQLNVETYSAISSICIVKNLGLRCNDLENRLVIVGEQEALSILRASLTSSTVLTDVFCQ